MLSGNRAQLDAEALCVLEIIFKYFREEDRCNFRENAILVQIRLQTSS